MTIFDDSFYFDESMSLYEHKTSCTGKNEKNARCMSPGFRVPVIPIQDKYVL